MQVVPEAHMEMPRFGGGPRTPGRAGGEMSSGVVSCSQQRPPSQSSPLGSPQTVICLINVQLLGRCWYQELYFSAAYGQIYKVRSWGEGVFQAAKLKFTLKKQLVFRSRHHAVFPW